MADITDAVNLFSEFSTTLVRDHYLPTIHNVTFDPQRSWFINRLRRTSDNIEGLTLKVPFITQIPWSFRGMTETGYTPTGSKISMADQTIDLSNCAAAAIATHKEIVGLGMDNSKMNDFLAAQMRWIMEQFPYMLRAILWTGSGTDKALGIVASVSTTTVTIDNTGLWHTSLKDRCKLIEPGMIVQFYTSADVKRGEPVKITGVNKGAGTFTIANEISGLADGDYFVPSDIGGLDVPGMTSFNGLPDLFDDDNTFQGVNRATAGNEWAQVYNEDASAWTFGYDAFSDFFDAVYNPLEAFTHKDVVKAYFSNEIRGNVRYTPSATYMDGFEYVEIDRTKLFVEWDCDRDKILVPDFANMYIGEVPGGLQPLFGDTWRMVPGRPFVEMIISWWAAFVAEDCRRMGLATGLVLP